MTRDFFRPGRSPVSGLNGAVASSHALASAAALTTLAQGGNAVDAAITASFVLCVVEPQSTGIGGDCFALYFPAGQTRPVGFNGSGATPAALDPERARTGRGLPLAESSVHAVTIPGAIDGLVHLATKYGRWELERLLAPAIAYAENGYPISQRVADEWEYAAPKLHAIPASRAALLPGDRAPAPGAVFHSPALAATLRLIAKGGADAFYRGAIAGKMARFLSKAGGFHAAQDFAAHCGEEVEPISTSYRGHDVWEMPPNGQGATALLMLNILENFDLGRLPFDGAARHSLISHAARLAFGVRNRLIADPRFAEVQLNAFLDKARAKRMAAEIDDKPHAESSAAPAARGDTAYVSVVDRDRNAISLISSLFEGFGTGLYDPETGVIFHNRGSGFCGDADHPNALAPAKRPLHTILPGMVSHAGRPVMSFGVTGGPYQPTGHIQLVTGMIDHGLDIQEVIDRPRSFLRNGKLQLEPALAGIGRALAAHGHDVVDAPSPVGGAHGITIDWDRGVLTGGSDARKDGCALAF